MMIDLQGSSGGVLMGEADRCRCAWAASAYASLVYAWRDAPFVVCNMLRVTCFESGGIVRVPSPVRKENIV